MTAEDKFQLDLDGAAVFADDGYDPLFEAEILEKDSEERAETFGYVGEPGAVAATSGLAPGGSLGSLDAAANAASAATPATPATPAERITNLFASMIPYKRNFLGILEFCRQPQSFEQLESYIAALQTNRRDVYTTTGYCQMLTDAGALAKVSADGTDFALAQSAPVEVERDGQTFLEPAAAVQAFWQTTAAGLQALDDDDPLAALRAIFAQEAKFKGIFVQLLEFCNRPSGASIDEIKQTINKDPVLEYPAKTAQFFMDYLERNGALVWDVTWKTTDLGKRALAILQV